MRGFLRSFSCVSLSLSTRFAPRPRPRPIPATLLLQLLRPGAETRAKEEANLLTGDNSQFARLPRTEEPRGLWAASVKKGWEEKPWVWRVPEPKQATRADATLGTGEDRANPLSFLPL